MSDHADRVHRHARWILEAATEREIGFRGWGPHGNVRYWPAGCLYARAVADWTVCDPQTVFRGLLHDRLLAVARAEERAEWRRRVDAVRAELREADKTASNRWSEWGYRAVAVSEHLDRALELLEAPTVREEAK